MIRRLWVAALVSALATFVCALSVRASGLVVAVAAVAAVTVFATWLCALHSTDEESGLALANPAWALGFSLAGRFAPVGLVPVFAAQVVGAVIAGVAVLGLQTRLPDAIVWAEPEYLFVVVIGVVLAVIGIWIAFGIDQHLTEPYAALGTLIAGGMLPVGLAGVLNPAVVLGIAIVGVLSWPIAGLAIAAVFAGTIAGTALGKAVSPTG